MKLNQICVSAMIFSALFFAGCGTRKDVSDDPRYYGGFKKGYVYRATMPLALQTGNYVKGYTSISIIYNIRDNVRKGVKRERR